MAPTISTWASVALSALPLAAAHMNLKHPVPFDLTELKQDRSPLTTGEYPCKMQTYSFDQRTELSVGQSYTMDFYPGDDAEVAEIGSTTGAAVHDGGSCQLLITTDKEPTVSSVFKVFHSIEGGCPGLNNQASTFQYSLPDSIPNGDVTFAWTWFPVSSQQPEMYMNCAPVTVTGGSDDTSAFDALPDIFVANIGFNSFTEGLSAVSSLLTSTVTQTSLLASGQIPSCLAEGEAVLQFPNPGDSVDKGDTSTWPLKAPSGQCSGGSGKAAAGTKAASTSAAAQTSVAQTQQQTTFATSTKAAATSVAAVFAEQSSVAAVAETQTQVAATTLLTSAAAAVATTEAAAPAAAVATTAAAAGSTTNSACTSENDGQVVCNGESQFGLCNAGSVVWQDVSEGTVCQNGQVVGAQ